MIVGIDGTGTVGSVGVGSGTVGVPEPPQRPGTGYCWHTTLMTEPGRPTHAATSPRRSPSRHVLIASSASWHSRLVSGSGPSCGRALSGMHASVGSVVGIVVGIPVRSTSRVIDRLV